MKEQINPTLHSNSNLNASTAPDKSALSAAASNPTPQHKLVFKLGLDLDLHTIVVATQPDNGTIGLAQKFTRPNLLAWVKEKLVRRCFLAVVT